MAKYINKITGNIVVPKHAAAEELMAASDNYVAVNAKPEKPILKGKALKGKKSAK